MQMEVGSERSELETMPTLRCHLVMNRRARRGPRAGFLACVFSKKPHESFMADSELDAIGGVRRRFVLLL